jgi:tricorn protease
MKLSHMAAALLASTACLTVGASARAALARFPQPYGGRIVFVADGDLWSVGRNGGMAERLTSAPGQDMMPRVSPDGRWIAYTEATRAGTDIWVMPSSGGTARRLTYEPTTEFGTGGRHGPDSMVVTWTPDSKAVVYLTKKNAWNDWIQELYAVPVAGGPSYPLPLDSAVGLATYSPDGRSIAYNRIFRNFRTWKRYNGGLAQQVYTYDFSTRKLTQVTDWSGTNTSPMWYGRKIYYLSDQDANRRANIWVKDLDSGHTREVTHFTDFDIDFPALGDDAIAFQQGGKLWRLDLRDESLHEVPITVPDDGLRTRARVDEVKDEVRDSDPAGQVDYALAPNGRRTLFSARGDLFSVPTEHGGTRDLTGTTGIDEDHPAWSPDGRSIAYTTDVGGGQQVAVRPAEGGPERVLTHFKTGYFYGPMFSPDGRTLAFSDGAHRLWLLPATGGEPRMVAQDKVREIHDQAFSPDARWLAFSMAANNRSRTSDLYLYEIASGQLTRVSEGGSSDANPVFSPDGKYLYFTSNRHENTVMSDVEFDFALLKTTGVYAIPLSAGAASPDAPRSDEADSGPDPEVKPKEPDVSAGKGDEADRPSEGGKGRRKAPAGEPRPSPTHATSPIRVDLDGMMRRAVALPIDPANLAQMDARGDRIYYLTQPISDLSGPLKGESSALHFYDVKTRKDSVVTEDVDSYSLSRDGERVLVKHGGDYTVLDTKADAAKDSETRKKLNLDHMRLMVEPRAEWAEMFENGWRLERDMFFSPVMNGQDWQAVHDKYVRLLPLLGSREDLNYLLGQVLGEIGNSHTYVGGGDDGDQTPRHTNALLGADFQLDPATGRYRITRIYPGDNTRDEYRSPLGQPGLKVKAGDYLLSVDGIEVRAPETPDSALQLADSDTPVDVVVADSPTAPPRHLLVRPVDKELSLHEAAQIEHNREVVDRLSGGRVGYVYMSDMSRLGLQQFVRQFYAQLTKDALIMDDRWNGGGFVAPFALERLRRTLATIDVNREGSLTTEPAEILDGPKVALLNHWSASDGDIFPDLFKRYHLGPLVGTRSWGGVRGIRGDWKMMDGGYVTIPEEAPYDLNGVWVAENHGVDPDYVVEDEPADLLAGRDAQLETAVGLMMKALQGRASGLPAPPPLVPAYPPAGVVAPKP